MSWYSILPPHLTSIETWIIRFFLFLALVVFSPWIIAILYDLSLYIARRSLYELPIWGGRARGETRPRAPSLEDRQRRRVSFLGIIGAGGNPTRPRDEDQTRSEDGVRQRQRHKRGTSDDAIEEEE